MTRRLVLPAAIVTGAGLIAYPLARSGSARRRTITNIVVGGLAATTTAAAASRWNAARALLGALTIGTSTALVEWVGTATGVPFGRYRYTGRLRPAVAGIPVAVPAAWWAMALPARETAQAALGRRTSRFARAVLGAGALTAWDLFLDPQLTSEGYWRWSRGGRYRGIPASNYAGWLVTGLLVMVALDVLLPPGEPEPVLIAEYGAIGAMEAFGFAAFFGDRRVAAVGGAAMLPLAALAVARCCRG